MTVLQPRLQTTVRTLLEAGASQRDIQRVTGIDRKTTRALADGLTVHRAAEFPGVAPSTAFRWRHRFLSVPGGVEPATASLTGVAEMDETYFMASYKGRKVVGRAPHKRGGRAA